MTASPAALLALASEIEAGTGLDREMDARVDAALFGEPPSFVYPYTRSVDSALALLARVLPGWVSIRTTTLHSPTGQRSSAVEIRPIFDEQIVLHCGEAPTLPRAIVAAVLRAVAARGDG